MKKNALLVFLVFVFGQSFAQNYAIFKAGIVLNDGTKQRGVLYDVNDTEVWIVSDSQELKQNVREGKSIEMIKIPQEKIRTISIRRKGFFLRNVIGSIVLLGGTGALIGYASGDDKDGGWFNTAESKAALGVIVGVYGSIYAAPIVSIFPKKRFHSKMLQEEEYRKRLRRFSLQYQKEHWKAAE